MVRTDIFDVVILGAGAAGLFCGITAAKRGLRVLVLEKSNKVGKKILMSGGGRCNFTNLHISSDNFVSSNPHFCKSALARYTQWDFIEMVERYKVEYEERKHGQLFCVKSAKDILGMLLSECAAYGVQIETHIEVDLLEKIESSTCNSFKLSVSQSNQGVNNCELLGKSIVVATGALSVPTLGGSGKGYDIANQFGLNVLPRNAGLVPLMFEGVMKELCEALSGVSLEVEVSCNGKLFLEKMLFTHRGISGPAILQISNYWKPGCSVEINLLPLQDATQMLQLLKKNQPSSMLRTVLKPYLPKALISKLQQLWWSDLENCSLAGFTNNRLDSIGKRLNRWVLKPSASEGYRTAEVTLGGVDTNELSSQTMESKRQSSLFFIGEVVDVAGHLGGFNFQWAWSSGYAAGLAV